MLALLLPAILVVGGDVYNAPLLVELNLNPSNDWVSIYGLVVSSSKKVEYTYYLFPFLEVSGLSSATVTSLTFDTSSRSVFYTGDIVNWYVLMAPADVNVYSLYSTCGKNPDILVEGNFEDDVKPSRTFTNEENIVVNGREYCALYADGITRVLS